MTYTTEGLFQDLYNYINKYMDEVTLSEFEDILGVALGTVIMDIYWESLGTHIVNYGDSRVAFNMSTFGNEEQSILWNSDLSNYSTYLKAKVGYEGLNPEFEYVYSVNFIIYQLLNEDYVHEFIADHLKRIRDSVDEFKTLNQKQTVFI